MHLPELNLELNDIVLTSRLERPMAVAAIRVGWEARRADVHGATMIAQIDQGWHPAKSGLSAHQDILLKRED